MKNSVSIVNNGVKIAFSRNIKRQNIIKMVDNCSTGACECMSDETKQKITNMQVEGSDGDVSLTLTGDISQAEIEDALAKSKVVS
jgi:hypothetical protein